MKPVKKPKTKFLSRGKVFRNLKILAEGNTMGPEHTASEESVLVVLKGSMILKSPDEEVVMAPGDSIIIPAGVKHSLEIIEDTEAIHIMSVDNEFEFFTDD